MYISWGHVDSTLRLSLVEGNKLRVCRTIILIVYSPMALSRYIICVLLTALGLLSVCQAVYRNMHDGQITAAAVSDDGSRVITCGSDSVVTVWKRLTKKERSQYLSAAAASSDRSLQRSRSTAFAAVSSGLASATQRVTGGPSSTSTAANTLMVAQASSDADGEVGSLVLLYSLHGHGGQPTCVAVSKPYGIIVTGAADNSVIVWDLHKAILLRQFRVFKAPVSAVAINKATGDVVACSRSAIYVWDVNGLLLASFDGMGPPSGDVVSLAVGSLSGHELVHGCNLIATGHNDGSVKLWQVVCNNAPGTGMLAAPAAAAPATGAATAAADNASSTGPFNGVAMSGSGTASLQPPLFPQGPSDQWTLSPAITPSASPSHSPRAAAEAKGTAAASATRWRISAPKDAVSARADANSNTLHPQGFRTSPFENWKLMHVHTMKRHHHAITALHFAADMNSLWSGDASGILARWTVPESIGYVAVPVTGAAPPAAALRFSVNAAGAGTVKAAATASSVARTVLDEGVAVFAAAAPSTTVGATAVSGASMSSGAVPPCACKKSKGFLSRVGAERKTANPTRRYWCPICLQLLCPQCRLSHPREEHPLADVDWNAQRLASTTAMAPARVDDEFVVVAGPLPNRGTSDGGGTLVVNTAAPTGSSGSTLTSSSSTRAFTRTRGGTAVTAPEADRGHESDRDSEPEDAELD